MRPRSPTARASMVEENATDRDAGPATLGRVVGAASVDRASRLRTGTLALLAFGAFAFFLVFGLRYFGPVEDPHFEPRLPILRVHILFGAVALVLGPIQFMDRVRRAWLDLHRWTGRVYLAAVAIGGVTGLYLAAFANGGLPGQTGFAGLSVAWLATSGMAYAAVRARRISEHRRWMIRSYVVTLAFVWVRLLLGLGIVVGAETQVVFGVAAWASWVVPLLLVEMAFRRRRVRS